MNEPAEGDIGAQSHWFLGFRIDALKTIAEYEQIVPVGLLMALRIGAENKVGLPK